MNIAPYADSDFDAVVALWDACGLNVAYNDPASDIARLRRDENAALFVGREKDKLIGSIIIGHDGHRGWIYRLAIAPDRRRQGHARALVRHAEGWLKEQNIRKSQFMIRDSNEAVKNFYVRLGYEVQPRIVMARWVDNDQDDPPAPTLDVVITHLEMLGAPKRPTVPAPPGRLALLKLEKPTIEFYRYLYDSVGEQWFWWERRQLSADKLHDVITQPTLDIYVLYVGGEPAGYVELNRQAMPEINVDYFGLMPHFTGRGYGGYFLNWAVDQAWSHEPKRLTVASCSLDDPRGLRTYQKAGFVPYQQERRSIIDPRALGLIPGTVQPRRT